MKWVAKRRRQGQKEAKHGEVVEKQRAGEKRRSRGTRGGEPERGVKNENRDGADIEQTCTHSIQIS